LGVKQRERLTKNLDAPPHMLLMTATPIPRTLAIMQYGGLSLSTIMQLPPGRTPVETHVVLDGEQGRQEVGSNNDQTMFHL
jgi:ATP-dependent DNA helicase RecG